MCGWLQKQSPQVGSFVACAGAEGMLELGRGHLCGLAIVRHLFTCGTQQQAPAALLSKHDVKRSHHMKG